MSNFNKNNYKHPQRSSAIRANRDDSYTSAQSQEDYGPAPLVVDIEKATLNNNNFRTTLWTGKFLQLALMSIAPGESIGLEVHDYLDQFIRIEQGKAIIMMGDSKDRVNFKQPVFDDYAIIIPAGKWHNLINVGSTELKLYTIYAPPEHLPGTIHQTKAIAEEAQKHHK